MAGEFTLDQLQSELDRRQRSARLNAPDGRYNLNDLEAELARRRTPPNRPRSSNPTGRRPNANTISGENAAYATALIRRANERRNDISPEEMRTGQLRNGGRDIPVPEALIGPAQALQNFNRNSMEWARQMPRNIGIADEIAAASTYLGQGSENLARRAQGRPIEIPAATAAQAAADYENRQGALTRQQMPIQNAIADVGNFFALGGTPAGAGHVSMLQAGLGAAGVNAPFALARQEGSLSERLPGAALETAVVGAFGAGMQGLANRLTAPRPPSSASQRSALFERAGVRPTAAAVTAPEPPSGMVVSSDPGRVAVVSRAIAENPIVGFMPMGHMRRSLRDTAAGAQRISQALGDAQTPEVSGAQIQQGLRRFAMGDGAGNDRPAGSLRNWSFDQRAKQLYERWWSRFNNATSAWTARNNNLGPQAVVSETQSAFNSIFGRNTADVANALNDKVVIRLRDLTNGQRPRTFQDLRDLRTYVRTLQTQDPSVRPTMPDATLQRIEGALTKDMYATAERYGGTELARELRQIDRYYRTGSERISSALRPFLREGESPRQAYDLALAAATDGGRQNTNRLRAVRSSLQPDEWRQFVSTVVDQMGRAGKGHPFAAEGAFSVEQFATRYNALSADGRRALFGSLGAPDGAPAGGAFIDLERALDDLARVAGMQKAVERAANTSNSAVAGQAVVTITGLVRAPVNTLSALFAMGVTGEMLTNPAFVRWIVSTAQAGGGAGGMRRTVAELGRLVARDPALAPFHAELIRRLGDQSRPEAQNSPSQEAQQEPYRSPAQ